MPRLSAFLRAVSMGMLGPFPTPAMAAGEKISGSGRLDSLGEAR